MDGRWHSVFTKEEAGLGERGGSCRVSESEGGRCVWMGMCV